MEKNESKISGSVSNEKLRRCAQLSPVEVLVHELVWQHLQVVLRPGSEADALAAALQKVPLDRQSDSGSTVINISSLALQHSRFLVASSESLPGDKSCHSGKRLCAHLCFLFSFFLQSALCGTTHACQAICAPSVFFCSPPDVPADKVF